MHVAGLVGTSGTVAFDIAIRAVRLLPLAACRPASLEAPASLEVACAELHRHADSLVRRLCPDVEAVLLHLTHCYHAWRCSLAVILSGASLSSDCGGLELACALMPGSKTDHNERLSHHFPRSGFPSDTHLRSCARSLD